MKPTSILDAHVILDACPPALKDGVGDLTAPDMKCYHILSSENPDETVNLTTQFGLEEDVSVFAPQALCVPALKEVVFPIPDSPYMIILSPSPSSFHGPTVKFFTGAGADFGFLFLLIGGGAFPAIFIPL